MPASAFGETMKDRKSFLTVLSNAGWLTGTRLIGDLASLFLFVILARHFGPTGIGQYAYGLAIAGFVYALVLFGLEEYGIRECSRLSAEERRVFIGRLVGTQLGTMALVSLLLLGFLYIRVPSASTALIVILLAGHQAMQALARTLFVPAFSQQSMSGPAIAELVSRVIVICAAIILVLGAHTSLAISLIPFPIGGFLIVILAAASAKRHNGALNVTVNWRESFMIFRSVWPFSASEIVDQMYSRAGLILLTLILGEQSAGIFASSLKFLEVGIVPIFFLGIAVYPTLSRLFAHSDQSGLLQTADSYYRASLFAGGLLALGLYFVVPLLVVPLFGEEFAASESIVKSIAVLGPLIAMNMATMRLLVATHLQVRMLKIQFWGLVILVVLSSALVPIIGVLGVVVGLIGSEITIVFLYLKTLQGRMPIANLVKTVMLFAAVLLAAFFVGEAFTRFSHSLWLPVVASMAVFGALIVGTGYLRIPNISRN